MKKPTFGLGGNGTSRNGLTGPGKGAVWLGWLLSTCGFGILLGGVAAMQQACGGTPLGSTIENFGGGSTGYLGPVGCSHLFQYTWWIVFLHFFVWFLILMYLLMGVMHKTRGALIGILAVASVLLMDTANTYLMFNYIQGFSGTMASRIRTTVAGAIVAAVADMFLILVIGWDSFASNERVERHEHYPAGATAVPATTTTTTAAGTVPVHVPV
ncbi:hypothetical protein ABPG77_003810 [Micractinium sp. CCAP 211/92]